MKAKDKNRIYALIVKTMYPSMDLTKGYWELNWEETTRMYALADAFNIKPKAGATKGRTLYERIQKGA